MVPLPRLLDESLLEIARLHPDSLNIDLSLSPLSSANMTVSQDEAKIEVGQFIELFTVQGSAGKFVVKSVDYDPDNRAQSVYMEHGLSTLSDSLMEGEEEQTGTARELLTALLNCQSRRMWRLGEVDVPDETTLKWECDYSNVLESIVNLMEQLPTYALTFDQSITPWVLHVVEMPNEDICECRLTRNMESVSINIDRTDLCTRLFVRGVKPKKEDDPLVDLVNPQAEETPEETPEDEELPELNPSWKFPKQEEIVDVYTHTIEADTMAVWGVVDRVLEADRELPENELIRQGEIYLEERKNPAITITLDAYELQHLTGEPFDRFTLGCICRVCLPEYGAVIRHRVVALTYPDALGEPDRVTVTLATKRADGLDTISGIIVNTALMAEQIGRLQINKIVANGLLELLADQIRLHAKHILLEADKIELLAEEILLMAEEIKMIADRVEINAEEIKLWGTVTEGLKTSFAQIDIDVKNALITLEANQEIVEELGKRVSQAEIKVDGANAKIDLYATRTDETISGLDKRITTAEIDIDGANAAIALKASQEDVDDLDRRVTTAEIDIDGANAAIALKASQEDVDDLDTRVTTAEIDIDGANAAIALKASQEDVDELGERVSSAEISINGLESEIALKADTILLDGYVKASDLETDVLEVVNASYIETLSAGFIGCGDIDAEQVNCTGVATDTVETDTLWVEGAHIGALSLGGTLVSSASKSVVVSMNGLTKEYTEIWYMDSDGTEQYARVLTNVELRYPNTATINYLTTDASGGT